MPLKRITFTFLITFAGATSLSGNADACWAPPEHLYLDHEKTIEDAEWIVRAKGSSRAENGIKMIALEYLKGSGPETFILERATTKGAQFDDHEPNEANYYGHTVSTFWINGGRSGFDTDCKTYPSILFGDREYLIFGPRDYNLGYENIIENDDEWVRFVKTYIENGSAKKPIDSFEDYVKNAEAIIRFSAHWDNDRAVWKEEILKGEKRSYANMFFASPSAFFDTAVDPNCLSYGEPRTLAGKPIGAFDQIFILEKLPNQKNRSYQYLECAGKDKSGDGTLDASGIFSTIGHAKFKIKGETKRLIPLDVKRIMNKQFNASGIEYTLPDLRDLIASTRTLSDN